MTSTLFQGTFSQKAFADFVAAFLPDYVLKDSRVEQRRGFTAVKQIGESSMLDLAVFIATPESSIHARMAISKDSYALLKNHPRAHAIIAYYADDTAEWRLSLITTSVTRDKKGIKETISNPRRFSYVLGPGAKVNTPTKYLIKKGRVSDLEDLKQRFSLEVVNKEFYQEISRLFVMLTGGTFGAGRNEKKYNARLRLPSGKDKEKTELEFGVRLIGRVIYCWFLREKMGENDTPLMPAELLSSKAVEQSDDYYHQVLEPIFFEVLNKQWGSRKQKYDGVPYSAIPYLNGGLFSPEHDDHYSYVEKKQARLHEEVIVPDSWLREFFAFLETFNFTIDENVSFDEELSIDPEMLGRIFENLLAEINPETGESARKSTGSYYTPRSIVEYMVDEGLFYYLRGKTSISDEKLRAVISYDLDDDIANQLEDSEYTEIVDSLSSVKILDPACGSGAFPIGALQKIVFILQQVDPDSHKWFEKQIRNVAPEIRRVLEREFAAKNFNYIRKLGVIRENIFGVDIQPIATEISRLRCFLTLVVDESIHDSLENRGIEPLPNLDFKFVTANTLLGLPGGNEQTLFGDKERIEQLRDLRNQFFSATNSERHRLKLEFKEVQNKMLLHMLQLQGGDSLTMALSAWDPFSHQVTPWFDSEWMFGVSGFDLVIANPPYVRQEKFTELKPKLREQYADFFDGRADLYTYFIKLGFNLANKGGIFSYITSNKFFVRGYGENTRILLTKKVKLLEIINFGELPVFQAAVDSAILLAVNNAPEHGGALLYAQAKHDSDIQNISQFFHDKKIAIKLDALGAREWSLQDSDMLAVLEKIRRNKNTLSQYFDGHIYGGIKTGFDDAFVIDAATKSDLINKDRSCAQMIEPWLRGKDVRKWHADYKDLYVIYTSHKGFTPDKYPSIKNHLSSFKKELEQRATNQRWYEMQQPQVEFTKLYDGPKMIYPDCAKEMRAMFDQTGAYGTMAMYFTPFDPIIMGILNSRLFDWYARMSFATFGDPWNSGRIIFKTIYMSKVPIPDIKSATGISIGKHVDEILTLSTSVDYEEDVSTVKRIRDAEEAINVLVYKLYRLSEEDVRVIENSYKILV